MLSQFGAWVTFQVSQVMEDEWPFEQLIHTVSSYPASIFCFAVIAPVPALMARLEPEQSLEHPEAFKVHAVMAPHDEEKGLVKNETEPGATVTSDDEEE